MTENHISGNATNQASDGTPRRQNLVSLRMSKRTYYLVASSYFWFVSILEVARGSFGREFVLVVAPGLLLLNTLQWFVLPNNCVWRLIGFASAFGCVSVLYFSYSQGPNIGLPDFSNCLFLVTAAESIVIWFLTSDGGTRAISIVTNLTTLFAVPMGFLINSRAMAVPEFSGARLTLCPIAVMLFVAKSSIWGWRNHDRWGCVLTIAQIGIGLLDLGGLVPSWIALSFVPVLFIALGLTLYWAKNLNDMLSG